MKARRTAAYDVPAPRAVLRCKRLSYSPDLYAAILGSAIDLHPSDGETPEIWAVLELRLCRLCLARGGWGIYYDDTALQELM